MSQATSRRQTSRPCTRSAPHKTRDACRTLCKYMGVNERWITNDDAARITGPRVKQVPFEIVRCVCAQTQWDAQRETRYIPSSVQKKSQWALHRKRQRNAGRIQRKTGPPNRSPPAPACALSLSAPSPCLSDCRIADR